MCSFVSLLFLIPLLFFCPASQTVVQSLSQTMIPKIKRQMRDREESANGEEGREFSAAEKVCRVLLRDGHCYRNDCYYCSQRFYWFTIYLRLSPSLSLYLSLSHSPSLSPTNLKSLLLSILKWWRRSYGARSRSEISLQFKANHHIRICWSTAAEMSRWCKCVRKKDSSYGCSEGNCVETLFYCNKCMISSHETERERRQLLYFTILSIFVFDTKKTLFFFLLLILLLYLFLWWFLYAWIW